MISYFLGANTPSGFYSLYHQLIPRESAKAVYYIKGGPGCGKSTFMRQIANAALAGGYRTETIFCSGDPDSLDGLVLPELGVAFADATAPHVLEPTLPGAVDHYINLEPCYDAAALAKLRPELEAAMTDYKGCYDRAYRCLAAAEEITSDCRSLLGPGLDDSKLARRVKGILSREFRKKSPQSGRSIYRFLSAISCSGQLCLWDTVTEQCSRVYVLEDSYGLSHRFLSSLLQPALAAGQDCIVCLSPLNPDLVEHLLFPGAGLAFVTSSPALPYPGKAYRRIHLDAMLDPTLVRSSRSRLRFSHKVSAALMEEAISSLQQAKQLHDGLEALYHPHVDFEKGAAMARELIFQLGLEKKTPL